jgi:hypothetical protein
MQPLTWEEIMKATKLSMKALFGIFVIVAVAIVVAAALVISNTVVLNNYVQPANTGAELKVVGPSGGNPYPGDGYDLRAGVTYRLGVELIGHDSYSNVIVIFSILNHDALATPSDVSLSYYDGLNWQVIPLTASGSTLSASFGPPSGFAIWNGYDVTTEISVVFNVSAHYTVNAEVETV